MIPIQGILYSRFKVLNYSTQLRIVNSRFKCLNSVFTFLNAFVYTQDSRFEFRVLNSKFKVLHLRVKINSKNKVSK